jgi:hypothetical protein
VNNSEDAKRGAAAGPSTHCAQTSDGPPLRDVPPQDPPKLDPEDKDQNGKPRPRKFETPVAWLFGRQLVRSLKGILLYSAYGSKLDPREWMASAVHTFAAEGEGRAPAELWDADAENYPDGFWFDYISDTGDGMRATYSIAYLCLSDLAVPTLDAPGEKVGDGPVLRAGDPATPVIKGREAGPAVLPRGEFLFIGGDTAYHASDYMTLGERIQKTFRWAYRDLVADGGLGEEEPPRPVFGIPGNHDYYDQLDGFRRQFLRPVFWEPTPPEPASAPKPPHLDEAETAQLILRGFYRTQTASYLALRLPFGWHMWGLDTETGQIDDRQTTFFRQFCRTLSSEPDGLRADVVVPPKRLIVATCSPTTFFGKLANPKDFKSADAFGQLGIEQPFLPEDIKRARRSGGRLGIPYNLRKTGDYRLKRGQCRLDLSGDVHHYARYWGPEPPDCTLTPRPGEDEKLARLKSDPAELAGLKRKNQPSARSYASIVSGIGGAFHHPSQTYFGEVREQSLYPSEKTSTEEVSRRVFKFWNIINGGGVWLAGLLLAFLVYFAFTVPQSSRDVLNNVAHFGLGLATNEKVDPPVAVLVEPGTRVDGECEDPTCVRPLLNKWLGVGDVWRAPAACGSAPNYFFFSACHRGHWPPLDFLVGLFAAVLLSSIPLIYATASKKLYGVAPDEGEKDAVADGGADEDDDEDEEPAYPGGVGGVDAAASEVASTADGNKIRPVKHHPETEAEPRGRLWVLTLVAAALFFGGLALVKPYRSHITPFGNSLLVLLTFVWAGACVALNLRYTEFLFKKSYSETIGRRDWLLTWVLAGLALVAAGLGLWSFGRNNLPALLASDIIFIAAVLGLCGGLIYALPFKVTDALFSNWPKGVRWLGQGLVGLWHFVLQLAVPFILVRRASWLTLIIVVVVIAVGTYVGEYLLARFKGWGLVIVWLALGLATLLVPLLPALLRKFSPGFDGGPLWHTLTDPWFTSDNTTGWLGLLPSVAAGLVGLVMCCYWFGWYLGVCFAFNGHNNEVGGAARIERFKQFIRFRLTKEGLTGYVIAVNDPSDTGSRLTPHVVDVFHLRPKA